MDVGILAVATLASHGLWFEVEMRLEMVPVIVLLGSALGVEGKPVLKSN